MAQISNGESGLSARNKLNEVIDKIEGNSAIGNDIEVTGTVTMDGGSTSADFTFGDNDKAIFGAGSDLQIYHDSSASYVSEQGVGPLNLLASQLNIYNASQTSQLAQFNTTSSKLFHDNAAKLATTSTGVDITGTLTSDGLTVDGNPVLAASVNNSSTTAGTGGLKVNTASTSSSTIPFYVRSDNKNRLRVKGNGDFELYEDTGTTPKMVWSAADEKLEIGSIQGGADGLLAVKTNANNHAIAIEEASGVEAYAIGVESDGSLGFYNSGSTTASVTFDDSGNVGIGTSSPDYKLEVEEVGTGSGLGGIAAATATAGGNAGYRWVSGGTSRFGMTLIGSAGSESLRIYDSNNSTERLRITSSGNVGIGTSSPSATLNLSGGGNAIVRLENNSSSLTTNSLLGSTQFYSNDPSGLGVGVKTSVNAYSENSTGSAYYMTFNTTSFSGSNDTERMRINSIGNVGIGTSDPSTRLDVSTSTSTIATFRVPSGGGANNKRLEVATGGDRVIFKAYTDSDSSAADIAFNNGATSEAMRITSSGNVGIGTSSPSYRLDLGTVSNGTTLFNVTNGSNSNLRFKIEDGVSTIMNTGSSAALAFTSGGTTERMRITSAGRVGIGKSSPDEELDIYASVPTIRLSDSDGSYSRVAHNTASMILQADEGGVGTGSMRFDVGGSETMRIDNSGRVGINTTFPDDKLHVYSSSSLDHIKVDGPAGINRNINFATAGSTRWNIYANSTAESGSNAGSNLSFGRYTDAGAYNGVAMLIERSSGRVGIGTSSPNRDLHVIGTATIETTTGNGSFLFVPTDTDNRLYSRANNASSTALPLSFIMGNTEAMRINSSGNVGIGTSSPTGTLSIDSTGGTSQSIITTSTNGSSYVNLEIGGINATPSIKREITFHTNAASGSRTERLRIDSSGNLLVGTTDTTPYNNNAGTSADQGFVVSGGRIYAATNGNSVSILNRTSTDGDIIQFRKNGTTVGSIGTYGGDLDIGTDDTVIRFNNGIDAIFPVASVGGVGRDNAVDLGFSGARFKDLYLSGGVYLGGTGSANKLDDYEEGTWTPVDGSGAGLTFSNVAANYTKIGRQVFIQCELQYPSTADVSDMDISGLPFAARDTFRFAGVMAYTTSTLAGSAQILNGQTTSIRFRENGSSIVIHNDQLSGVVCRFTMVYHTNS